MKVLIILSVFAAIVFAVGLIFKGSKFIHNIIDSLTTEKGGYSSRKIVAYIGLIFAGITSVKHTTADNAESILMTWLAFVLLALGLVTISQLVQLRTGTTTTTTDVSASTKTVKND